MCTLTALFRRGALPLALLALSTTAPAQLPERPNVVYFMADELGYYELSAMGHPHFETPRIDRMAEEGVRFTQALAGSALCAPTRGSLMTGKHSGHSSVRTNGGGTPLRAEEATVASVLKSAGYATGGFGKWGCGGRGSTGVPEQHGFDVFFGYYDQVHAHSYYPPYLVRNSEEVELPGNRGGRSGETYSHYVIFEAAKEFIRENAEQPFFCYLPVTPPHGMFDLPEDDPAWKQFEDKPWPLEARRYAAMVSMVDRQLGEVLDLLAELELDEKTIVFFCGDNGGMDYFKDEEHPRGFHGPNVNPSTGVEFRGQKGKLYEGGLRIPMIVRWPGLIEPGRVSDYLWYFPDVMPTVAELAGVGVPADTDGISIVPELVGAEKAGREVFEHAFLYWELGGQVAVRVKNWKAIRPGSKRDWELYDLTTDVSETVDLAEKHPEKLAEMRALAEAAHQPAREGVFTDRADHERDRRAKWGDSKQEKQSAKPEKVHSMPAEGLIPTTDWKVERVSSESKQNGKLARCAFDGDPRTHWHTRFQGEVAAHPHELVIDLGSVRTIRGVRYLARQVGGWNGTLAKCELQVSASATEFGEKPLALSFEKVREAQEVTFEPLSGRFVRLRILSEVNGGPWASIAEIGIIGD